MIDAAPAHKAADVYHLRGVEQRYGARTVLRVEDLALPAGQITAIVGPSGAGKSTLLRLLAFLERPAAGQLYYRGRPVARHAPDLAARRRVTMVFQRPHLLRRTVRANVAFGLRLREGGVDRRDKRVEGILARMGLTHLADAPASTLSGGEMQRVALARALVLDPAVMLLDEPTANLDPFNIQAIEQMVLDANVSQGTTIVVVTHNIFQARRLAHQVGLLLEGRLVELAPTAVFFDAPQQAETAAFIRGDIIY